MEGPMQAASAKVALPKFTRTTKRGYRKERYSAEFKQRAVERVRELGSVIQAAKELDLHPPTIHSWIYIVEHGGKLEPSKGWVPENGDRYLNPNPGHGSATPGSNDREREDLSPEVVTTIYERGRRMPDMYKEANSSAIPSGQLGNPLDSKEAQKQDSAFGQAVASTELRRLRAENEALRQIIRGYQSLLNLM